MARGKTSRLWRSYVGTVRPCLPLSAQNDSILNDIVAQQRRRQSGSGRKTKSSYGRCSWWLRAESEVRRTASTTKQSGGKDKKRTAVGKRSYAFGFKKKLPLFSLPIPPHAQGLKLKKQRSTGDLEKRGTAASGSIRSTVSTASWISTGSSQSAMSNK